MIPPEAPHIVTCRQIQEDGLDALYLAGRMSAAETLAFEQHCFRCTICWGLVTQGAGIRAATLRDRTDIPARTAAARALGRPPAPEGGEGGTRR